MGVFKDVKGGLQGGLKPYKEKGNRYREKTRWRHREEMAVYKERGLRRNQLRHSLISDLQAPEL